MARTVAVDFVVLGIPELRDKFRILPVVAQRKIIRQASRDIVKVWRSTASGRARALTNPANRTSRMIAVSRTFKVRAIKRSRRFVGARLLTGERERLGIKAGSRFYFPAHVHLGRRPTSTRRGVAAQKYLREPLLVHGAQWNRLMGTLIRDGIEREAAKKRLVIPPEVVID